MVPKMYISEGTPKTVISEKNVVAKDAAIGIGPTFPPPKIKKK